MQKNEQMNANQIRRNEIGLYTPKQIYELEKKWFSSNDSFSLMQQAAWQLAHSIKNNFEDNNTANSKKSVLVVAGAGNNGGDAWLVASYLMQLCPIWTIKVLEVGEANTIDCKKAKQIFESKSENVNFPSFTLNNVLNNVLNIEALLKAFNENNLSYHFDLIIDGLFGIGLDRQPMGDYQKIIEWINYYRLQVKACQVISIDLPSGLNATTGKVYQGMAIKADFTLCLIARKVGLHLGDSKDYVGQIIDVPLLPVEISEINLHTKLATLPKRQQVSHKGSYGHVLIIGGNLLDNGQGMAGAAILAAECAFASGVGKVTVACHRDFHPAIITSLPNAMTADLYEIEAIVELIKSVDVVAIGMGLGRDSTSFNLFKQYINAIISFNKLCVIDADGLYHLVDWENNNDKSDNKLNKQKLGKSHHQFYLTPHSAEAGRLLNQSYSTIDKDKLSAIRTLSEKYGGNWLSKGDQTIVKESEFVDICGLGNAGMATAGMGDCLAGLAAGLLAQDIDNPLLTSVLIHAKAGDTLAKTVGEYYLQASQMASTIGKIIHSITEE